MTTRRYPAWLGLLLGASLVGAALSVYLAGDWRSGDVSLYHSYALGFWFGLPHPLLPTEYPPLSILPLSLTLAGPSAWFPDVFAFWMGIIAALGYFAFRRWTSGGPAAAYALYVLAAGVATLWSRYDVLPALLAVAAVWLMERHRFAAAYPIIAIATLLKFFPIVLLPIAVIAHWRTGRRRGTKVKREIAWGVGVCLSIVVLLFAVAAVLDPGGWSSSLTVELKRPIEVESIPGTLLWLGSLAGVRTSPSVSFDSFNMTSALTPLIGVISALALVAGLLFTYWKQLRGRFTTGQAAVAALLVLLCTSKVLSAQYLIWLAPLLATTVSFQMRWLALFLLTALVFPTLWEVGVVGHAASVAYTPLFFAGIAVRNGLLVYLTIQFLLAPGHDREWERVKRERDRELPALVADS
jgi:Glycosyltransferase family 87